MKGIRRSLNKERIGAPTPTYSSLPTAGFPSTSQSSSGKGAPAQAAPVATRPLVAPAPPKRVIRAISSYRAASAQELSFEAGDFFHVVSEEGGEDWFDAANPMTGARGLVPAEHFQVLGRNVRETAQQATVGRKGSSASVGAQPSPTYGGPSMGQQQQQQQSQSHQRGPSYSGGNGQQGYVPTSSAPHQSTFMPSSSTSNPASPPLSGKSRNSRPPSQPAPKPQPLYGIVQYDFVAERADELDAKRGEPIIVIAQSNHEWFVAKPIGRLGGPGLIPVAFVEIQDMTTGKPVENVEELIRSAVVPKVEEWKKMTADYKSASIPLGRFDFAGASASSSGRATSPSSAQSPTGGANGAKSPYDDSQRYSSVEGTPHTNSSRPESEGYGDSTDNQRYSYTRERRQYGLVTSASVESFHHEEGSFWFHLRAFFSTGASLVLYRLYQDFYDFQIALMDEFPVEAGRVPPGGEGSGRKPERILPMMPGPTDYEDEVVCAQRVHDLSLYLGDLCGLPERIRSSGLMYEFLVPRAGDVEVAVGNGRGDEPGGGAAETIDGQYGELVEYLDQMDGGGGAGGQNGRRTSQQGGGGAARGGVEEDLARLSINGGKGQDYGYDQPRTQSRQSENSAGYASSTDQGSYQQTYQFNNPPPQQQASAPMGNANQNVPFIKIKIFHRNTDDLIAIRVPPTVSHASLLDKVRERLGNDVVNLRYREEVGSTTPSGAQVVMAGGARLVGVENDEDLERWIRGGSRLVLYAD